MRIRAAWAALDRNCRRFSVPPRRGTILLKSTIELVCDGTSSQVNGDNSLDLAFLTYRSDGCKHECRRRKASHRDRSCAAILIGNSLVRRSMRCAVEEREWAHPKLPVLIQVGSAAASSRFQSVTPSPAVTRVSARALLSRQSLRRYGCFRRRLGGLALGKVDRGDVVQSRKGRMNPPGSRSTSCPHCDPAARASGNLCG